MRATIWSPTWPDRRILGLAAAMVVGAGLSACGGAGGDPVQGAQIPRAMASSDQSTDQSQSGAGADAESQDSTADPADGGDSAGSGGGSAGNGGDSGGDGSRSGAGGSAGSGTSSGGEGSGGRKTGLPKSIRLPEIDSTTFRTAVIAACGSLRGNPSCLSVTITTEVDDSLVPGLCSINWTSEPPKTSDPNDPSRSFVERGSTITATEICPGPGPSAGSTDSATDGPTSTGDDSTSGDGSTSNNDSTSEDGGDGDSG